MASSTTTTRTEAVIEAAFGHFLNPQTQIPSRKRTMEKKGCKSVEKENGDLLTTSRRFRGQQPTEECSTAAKSQILTFRTYKLGQSKTILPVVI